MWCVRTQIGDRDRPMTGNTQLAERKPMFVLALPGELFAFAARTPAFAPLFQLPPTIRRAGRPLSSLPYLTCLSQPPN